MNSQSTKQSSFFSANFNEKNIMDTEEDYEKFFANTAKEKLGSKFILKLTKDNFWSILSVFIINILGTAYSWILPIVTSNIIDSITHYYNTYASLDESAALALQNGTLQTILINLLVVVVAIVAHFPLIFLSNYIFSKFRRKFEAALRGAMVRKLQHLSITFHKSMESGRIQAKVMQDVESISAMFNYLLGSMSATISSLIVSLFVIIFRKPIILLVLGIFVPITVILRRVFGKKLSSNNHNFRVANEGTSADVLEMEELVPVTRAHALENKEIVKITRDFTSLATTGFYLDRVNANFGAILTVCMAVMHSLVLATCGVFALYGIITIGEISLFTSYIANISGCVSNFLNFLPTLTKGNESVDSIGEILSAGDVETTKNKIVIKDLRGEYEFKNVRFDYDERTHVLNGLDLSVKQGETIALVGESGSGKSTIINMVIGFIKAQSGDVFVDGHNINDLNLHAYRKMISVVPQNTILFSGTIGENIAYGHSEYTKEQILAAVHAAQLDSVIEKLPDGLDTLVGEHGCKLSGGQRQRIAIARAIIRDPKVIVFDEATSALDSVTEREIQLAIDNLTKDRTTFIVAHRLSTIKNADKVAVIRDGVCVEVGGYQELIDRKGEFFHYKEMQS